ncbi:3'-5' exonuclease [Gilliamella sp. BG6]|uniref:3'-5' exonuclease n=1 Tax=unclassified Gilliamella TaxID=2685620 RepID=UPI0039871F68|nr:3'-5' exoribonuclease [Gilliamella sp.]
MTINTIIIDIETLDTKPTAIILSIGAFAFDRFNLNATLENMKNTYFNESTSTYHFYCVCDLNNQLLYSRRTISQSTLDWWRKQPSNNHKDIFLNNGKSLILNKVLNALVNKIEEWKENNPEIMFYFRGTDFDPVILKNAFEEYGLSIPWKYNQVRDIRTYIDALNRTNSGYIKEHYSSFNFMKHNALHDAMSDAEQMCLVSK